MIKMTLTWILAFSSRPFPPTGVLNHSFNIWQIFFTFLTYFLPQHFSHVLHVSLQNVSYEFPEISVPESTSLWSLLASSSRTYQSTIGMVISIGRHQHERIQYTWTWAWWLSASAMRNQDTCMALKAACSFVATSSSSSSFSKLSWFLERSKL